LRSQLERYIAGQLGATRVTTGKSQTELRKIKNEMAALTKGLAELQVRKSELEASLQL